MGCCKDRGGGEKKPPEGEKKPPDQGNLFEPRSKRCCTDFACLLLFAAAAVGSGYLTAASVVREPQLLVDLIYPTDSYGNNCGRPGTATEFLPTVLYPNLESDLVAQSAILATGAVWSFNPTRLCTPSCPAAFSLAAPSTYGGAGYPTSDNSSVPEILYPWSTRLIAARCFPFDTSNAIASVALCASPNCTDPGAVRAVVCC